MHNAAFNSIAQEARTVKSMPLIFLIFSADYAFASADAEEALLSDELSDALLSLELSELLSELLLSELLLSLELLPEAVVLLLLLKNEATKS